MSKKTVFISDIHAPYYDYSAISALQSFIKEYNPDCVIFIGDVVDFYSVSRYEKDPTRTEHLQDEIDSAVGVIDSIKQNSKKVKEWHFIAGNHEDRLQKFLWSKAPELADLKHLNVPSLLQLHSLGIKYHDSGRMKYEGLVVKHGDVVRKYSGYTARAEIEKVGMSGVSGHTHRLSYYNQTNEAGRYQWMEIGHLASEKQEYMRGQTPNWQQGFGVGYTIGRKTILTPIPIFNGTAYYGDKQYI